MIRVPGSTYRLQLNKDFTFEAAASVAEYLKQLGITHVYSSPYLQAAPGSMHGYDVVDHSKVNEELGGSEAHDRFCKVLGDTGLGQILDIVPNHMSLGEQNRYWWDVLENGINSRYASFFDLDWDFTEERLNDQILIPVLPHQYGRVIGEGGIAVVRRNGEFTVETSGQKFPATPESLALILRRAADHAGSDLMNFVAASYARLPAATFSERQTILARHRDKVVLHKLLERLCMEDSVACVALDRAVAELNANADALDEFLSMQPYRLAYWKTAGQLLGYRRFFDVNTLIGLRVEREYVFDETHALIIKWLESRVIDGVRVDHPDGLRDPLQYFRRLRERAPAAWVVAEKILEPGEWLRTEWPVEGTSGYDFLNMALGVLIHPDGLKRLGDVYSQFTGDVASFSAVAHDKKIAVAQETLGSDVNRLTSVFAAICENNRDQRDVTPAEIRRAIREVAACLSIYRTYVIPNRNEIANEDRLRIEEAIECAKKNRQDIEPQLFDFMRDVLELKTTGDRESEFVYRFQQFTSPVMAKGVEDTAFFCWNRLIAMNEVGGDPACDGFELQVFHDHQARMQGTFPATMVTLSTHDTKWSDDVRARLAVLTEMPDAWGESAERWRLLTAKYRKDDLIDPGTMWFLFQMLVGAWPISAERLKDSMRKAMREAKIRTSWVANNTEYETALDEYIEGILGDEMFVADVNCFLDIIALAGRVNSLSQILLKLTVPGVPDLYQGGELWNLSLIDPDNRRPVDYELRKRLLAEIGRLSVVEVMARMDEGLPKLWTIHHALQVRNEHPEWFGAEAEYRPLSATGPQANRAIVYLRGENVMTVTSRWNKGANNFGDTVIEIPCGRWRNRMTGSEVNCGQVMMQELLHEFPVALLVREG